MAVAIHKGPPLPPLPDSVTIPQFFLDGYHPQRPVRPTNHPWLIDDKSGKQYSQEDCRVRTHGLANALQSKWPNLKEDAVACIYSPNHLEYPITIWACHRLGLIVSGANPTYTLDELIYQLETTKATLLFTHPVSLDIAVRAAEAAKIPLANIILLEAAPSSSGHKFQTVDQLVQQGLLLQTQYANRKLQQGEGKRKVAFLSFSSGTTGRPKAVAIAHSALIANVMEMSVFNKINDTTYAPYEKRRFRSGDTIIGVLPFYHIYGLVVNLHWMIFCGMAIVVVPKFNYEDMLKSVVRYRITHLMLVPPQVVLLVKHPATKKYDLSSLRYIMVGAAPLSPEVTNQFSKMFPGVNLGQGYGMTETCTTVTMNPLECENGIPGCAGRLLPGTSAKILRPDGTPVDFEEPGELWVRGPQMALCYANNEQASKETFIDGWVRTGDEVMIDRDGNVFVTDRIKEIFKVKGFQVAPAELEGHILEHPDVADCAVIGIPDPYSGELPLAYVTLGDDAQKRVEKDKKAVDQIKKSIQKHVSDAKTRYKWLDGGVEFIDAIPKNPSGKLLRRVLRDKAKELVKERESKVKSKL